MMAAAAAADATAVRDRICFAVNLASFSTGVKGEAGAAVRLMTN